MFDNSNNTFEYKYYKQLDRDSYFFSNRDKFKSFVKQKSVKKKAKNRKKK